MYIIRNKKSGSIINDNAKDIDPELNPRDIYPDFDSETMEMLCTDLPPEKIFIHYNDLSGHFNIDENGFLTKKTLEEKAMAGSINFDPEMLKKHINENKTLKSSTEAARIVELATGLNLIKTVSECENAFKILDMEQESRLAEKYAPGIEIKITKAYTEWIAEEKPQNDEREQKYLKMQNYINILREEYKEWRAVLKERIVHLKALTAEKPDVSWNKEKIIEYMDAMGLHYSNPNDTKEILLDNIATVSDQASGQ